AEPIFLTPAVQREGAGFPKRGVNHLLAAIHVEKQNAETWFAVADVTDRFDCGHASICPDRRKHRRSDELGYDSLRSCHCHCGRALRAESGLSPHRSGPATGDAASRVSTHKI